MKNLDYYLNIKLRATNSEEHICLIEPDISGGKIDRKTIDIIKENKNATAITISGLTQDTFDYFIETYADRFDAINFWKCPSVSNLKKIENLTTVKYITYFWNQRAETLWDFSKTKSLVGLSFNDFTRLHDISDLATASNIEELDFSNKVWAKYIVKSLTPISKCENLKRLTFDPKLIEDCNIEPISKMKHLERLNFPRNLFVTEQVAWLKSKLPSNIESEFLNPYWMTNNPIKMGDKNIDTFIVGKRKPSLDSKIDANKIERYVLEFNRMYDWFLNNPNASPENYKNKKPNTKLDA